MITSTSIRDVYFAWIYKLAFPNSIERNQYTSLLNALAMTPFTFSIPLDENRMTDGIDLRYRFCYEHNLANHEIEGVLNANGCSILEMMIALSLRCDEHIMFDFDLGGQAHVWFFEMLKNLGLDSFTNYNFDEKYYQLIIDRWLNHNYNRDGSGGLFTIRTRDIDIRTVEIWYQLCWYLEENFRS